MFGLIDCSLADIVFLSGQSPSLGNNLMVCDLVGWLSDIVGLKGKVRK